MVRFVLTCICYGMLGVSVSLERKTWIKLLTGDDIGLTWSVILSRGTQQDQIIPPLQRSIALAPANTQDRLRPHSYCAPEYQQKLGTTERQTLFFRLAQPHWNPHHPPSYLCSGLTLLKS